MIPKANDAVSFFLIHSGTQLESSCVQVCPELQKLAALSILAT